MKHFKVRYERPGNLTSRSDATVYRAMDIFIGAPSLMEALQQVTADLGTMGLDDKHIVRITAMDDE